MIVVTAPVAGALSLNGRFAGEVSRENPLIAPVSPCGTLYLDYRPLTAGAGGVARRLAFSSGLPLEDSLAEADGLWCVAWPGGVLEVEIAPAARREIPLGEGVAFLDDGGPALLLAGARVDLPPDALAPRWTALGGSRALRGSLAGGGEYLAVLAADGSLAGEIAVGRVESGGGDLLTVVRDANDQVGHAALEQWLIDGSGLHRVSAEPVWARGAPRWPRTPEDTARAAVEAALEGLNGECDGYFAPALARERPLSAVGALCDACVAMKYAPPDPRPCVGLLRTTGANRGAVRPLYYRAVPGGGTQGPWQIEWISTAGMT